MINCDIIYPNESRKNHAFGLLREHASRFNIELNLKYMAPNLVSMADIAFIRGYDFELSKRIEESSTKLVNSTKAMQNSYDKYLSYSIFKENSIPTPISYIIDKDTNYFDASEIIGNHCFVLKYIFGSKGQQVWLIKCEEDYKKIQELEYNTFLVQEYIAESAGKDIRIWVAGDKASAAVMRKNNNSFKSNIACGATPYPIELTQELSSLAIKAARSIELEVSAVDILFGKDGYMVCEINSNAGFRSALSLGYDVVLDDMFSYISEKIK